MSDRAPFRFDAVELGPRPSDTPVRKETAADAPVGSHRTVDALRERFGDGVGHHRISAGDEHVMFVDASRNEEILRWLHEDPGQAYDHLADLTAVDHGGGRPLEVVYQLWSISHKIALRVKCELPLDALEIETVTGIWRGADWLEREVYDLFGIRFNGHPDLRRILMPETYAEGYPLRKDFPLRGRFSRAEQTRRALSQDPEDYYFPGEAGGREPQLVEAPPDDADEAEGSRGHAD